MKNRWLFSVLLLTLAFSACKKSSNNSNGNNGLPANCTNQTGWLVNGHEWVYSNDPIYFYADTLYIKAEDAGSSVFKLTNTFDDGTLYAPMIAYAKACGTDVYQSAAASMSNAYLSYKGDGNVNDTWTSTVASTGGYQVSNTLKITGVNVAVTVPAGTFTCIKVHMTSVSTQPGSITVETDIYYNNSVGMVKTDGTTAYYELVRKNF